MGFLVAPWCSGFFQHHIFPRAHGHIANSITGYIAARILWQEQVTGNIPDPSLATLIFTMGIPINTLEKNMTPITPLSPGQLPTWSATVFSNLQLCFRFGVQDTWLSLSTWATTHWLANTTWNCTENWMQPKIDYYVSGWEGFVWYDLKYPLPCVICH